MLRFTRTIFFALALALFQAALFAQFDSGSVTGLVKDATGSVVPGAKITLTGTANGISLTTQSNESGVYEFPSARVGSYQISAEKSGFSTATAANVVVSVATRTRVDLGLSVGAVTQTVEVSGGDILIVMETRKSAGMLFAAPAAASVTLLRSAFRKFPAAFSTKP